LSFLSNSGFSFQTGYGGNFNVTTSYSNILLHGYRGDLTFRTTDSLNVVHDIKMSNDHTPNKPSVLSYVPVFGISVF
jgi:hypothetical protein